MGLLYTDQYLPSDIQDAIRVFDYRYIQAGETASEVNNPLLELGDANQSPSPITSYPISYVTSKYVEFMGDNRTREGSSGIIDIRPAEYDNGFEVSGYEVTTNQV